MTTNNSNITHVGQVVTNSTAFATPVGAWFNPGESFTVVSIGSRNARLSSHRGDCVVWYDLAENVFVTDGK